MIGRRRLSLLLPGVLIAVLAVSRRATEFVHPKLWAEDATIFFNEFQSLGWASFGHPYASYLHLWPRVIAAFAGLFPLAWTAAIYFYAATIIFLYSCLCFARLGNDGRERAFLAMLPLIIPQGGEAMFTITNLQWILPLGCIGLLRDRRSWSAWEIFYLVLALGSGFTSLFALVAVLGRQRKSWLIAEAAALCAQLAVHLANSSPSSGPSLLQWPRLLELATEKYLSEGLVGEPRAHFGWVILLLLTLGWTYRKAAGKSRPLMLGLGCCGITAYLAAAWRIGFNFPDIRILGNGDRYLLLPTVTLLALLGAGLATFEKIWSRALPMTFIGAFLTTSLRHWNFSPWQAVDWTRQIEDYCRGTSPFVTVDPVQDATFRIRPDVRRCR